MGAVAATEPGACRRWAGRASRRRSSRTRTCQANREPHGGLLRARGLRRQRPARPEHRLRVPFPAERSRNLPPVHFRLRPGAPRAPPTLAAPGAASRRARGARGPARPTSRWGRRACGRCAGATPAGRPWCARLSTAVLSVRARRTGAARTGQRRRPTRRPRTGRSGS